MTDSLGEQRERAAADAAVLLELDIRPMGIDDGSFIIDSWCNSYRHSHDMRSCDENLYKVEMRNIVYSLIPQTKVLVACNPKDKRNIYGWACVEPPREAVGLWILHYVLVKPEYQNRGVAKALTQIAREASPHGLMWASMETIGLRKFGNGWLMVNKFLMWRVEGKAKQTLKSGHAPYPHASGLRRGES